MNKVYLVIPVLVLLGGVASMHLRNVSLASQPNAVDEAVLAAPTPNGHSLQPHLTNATIDVDKVVALLPPDAIPAILPDQVPEIMVTAAAAEEIGINSSVRVIGVSINGDSRAYPIPFMSKHEIVNDVIGGQPVAVTW